MPAGDPLSRHFLIPTRNAIKKVSDRSLMYSSWFEIKYLQQQQQSIHKNVFSSPRLFSPPPSVDQMFVMIDNQIKLDEKQDDSSHKYANSVFRQVTCRDDKLSYGNHNMATTLLIYKDMNPSDSQTCGLLQRGGREKTFFEVLVRAQ